MGDINHFLPEEIYITKHLFTRGIYKAKPVRFRGRDFIDGIVVERNNGTIQEFYYENEWFLTEAEALEYAHLMKGDATAELIEQLSEINDTGVFLT